MALCDCWRRALNVIENMIVLCVRNRKCGNMGIPSLPSKLSSKESSKSTLFSSSLSSSLSGYENNMKKHVRAESNQTIWVRDKALQMTSSFSDVLFFSPSLGRSATSNERQLVVLISVQEHWKATCSRTNQISNEVNLIIWEMYYSTWCMSLCDRWRRALEISWRTWLFRVFGT